MPDFDWKREIESRIGEVDPSILEELAQHLEARFEELGSYDAVMAEWSATELRAELGRIRYRKHREPPAPGNPALGLLSGIWQDIRYGTRQLRLNPGFATVAILSLALGIGANTAIFQLLDAVRLRTLPVENPQELVNIRMPPGTSRSGSFSTRFPQSTYTMWEQLRAKQEGFSGVLAWGSGSFDLAPQGETRPARGGIYVSGDFFNVLGVKPLLGRVFTAADDHPGCGENSAVISYAFWQREMGGSPAVLGKSITLDSNPFAVIGVTPASFYGVEVGRSYDVAIPLCADPLFFLPPYESRIGGGNQWWLCIMGRLKPGWTIERAAAQLAVISPGLFQSTMYPKWDPEDAKSYRESKLIALPAAAGLSDLRRQYEDPLWMLLSIAGLVLLIACANLANLMLARASGREREIAVRQALGASRARLIRQLLVESLLISVAGATFGAVLAAQLSKLLVSFLSTDVTPPFVEMATDWRMFAFLAGIAILTCILFGLAPAIRATKLAPSVAMKAGGRGMTETRERFGLRRFLVISQVALSLVLLVGSLFFVRSLQYLLTLDAGFQQNGVVEANLDAEKLKLLAARRAPFRQDLLQRVRAIPGVESAAIAAIVPISGNGWNQTLRMHGEDRAKRKVASFNRVSSDYFKTLGTPLRAGRDFQNRDKLGAPLVALVNETLAKKMINGANPVGRRIVVDRQGEPDQIYEVIGLVKDAKYYDLREDCPPTIYLAETQDEKPDSDPQILIRSSLPLTALLPSIRETLQQADSRISFNFRSFKTQVGWSLQRERLMAALSGLFGVLALILATVGLYGVISYTVARRTQEIGIRMALGAGGRRIASMIMREAIIMLAIGLTVGLGISLYAAQAVKAMLYNLKPTDPPTFAMAAGALAIVAVGASYLPALRASRLDPMVALREE
jgi:predicted permease